MALEDSLTIKASFSFFLHVLMLLVPVATWILAVLAVLAHIPHWVSGWPSFGLPNLQSNFPKLFANQLTPPNGEVWHGLWNQFDPLPCITRRTHETITLCCTHVPTMDFYSLQAGNILCSQHEKHVWVDTKVVSDAAFLHDRTRQKRLHQRQQKNEWLGDKFLALLRIFHLRNQKQMRGSIDCGT